MHAHRRGLKSPVFKILTSKLFDIRILQTLFANPAPRKVFRGYRGRGYPFLRNTGKKYAYRRKIMGQRQSRVYGFAARNAAIFSFRNFPSAALPAAPAVWPHKDGIGFNSTVDMNPAS